MNTSIEESRKVPINNLKCDLVEPDVNSISFNDLQMENFYLDYLDSLIEQYYAAEMETIHFNGSNQLPFESNTLNCR